MVKHIVFFKIKSDFSSEQKKQAANQIVDILKKLPSIIDEIKYYEIGINISDRQTAYDVALISYFDNKNDLETYRFHQAHQQAVQKIKQLTESSCVVDYSDFFRYEKK